MVTSHFLLRANFQGCQIARNKLDRNVFQWVTLCGNMGWRAGRRQSFIRIRMTVGKKAFLLKQKVPAERNSD